MTCRPPAIDGYPDARPFRDGLRMYGWTLRGFAHGAARRKSKVGARLFSMWMLVICIVAAPGFVLLYPAMIAWRRSTRYYMTPERDATLAITAKRDTWHVVDHITARPGSQRGRALRRGIAPPLTPALDQAGAALVTVAVSEERAQDYSADVPGLVPCGRAWPRGVKMRREPHTVLHNQVVNTPAPETSNRSRRKYGWLVAVGVVGYLVVAFFVILWAPAALLNDWVPGLTSEQRGKLLGSAGNLVLLSLGGVVAVVGVGISLSRHQQELEAAQRDRDRLNDDREREQARRAEVDAQRNVETERTLRERFVTTVQLLSDPSPVNRQAALFALGSLADDWDAFGKPDEVQVCIEVLTGYLRAPRSDAMLFPLSAEDYHALPDEDRRAAQRTIPQEVAAKQAGYIVIRNHLQGGASPGWHDRKLNLTDAHIDFTVDLRNSVLRGGRMSFDGAYVAPGGDVRLQGLRAVERSAVSFDGAIMYAGKVRLVGSRIEYRGGVSFRYALIRGSGRVDLRGLRIDGYLDFEGARIDNQGEVRLDMTRIREAGTINFPGAVIDRSGRVELRDARISGHGIVSFQTSAIGGNANVSLRDAQIEDDGQIRLRGATVSAGSHIALDGAAIEPGPITLPDGAQLSPAPAPGP